MELKPCPFCGSKEAVEYYCGHDMLDCPYYSYEDFEELGYSYEDDCKLDCDLRHAMVCCSAFKGGCGARSGWCDIDASEKWNTRYKE